MHQNLKDEHSNAQDHDFTNEDSALEDVVESEKKTRYILESLRCNREVTLMKYFHYSLKRPVL